MLDFYLFIYGNICYSNRADHHRYSCPKILPKNTFCPCILSFRLIKGWLKGWEDFKTISKEWQQNVIRISTRHNSYPCRQSSSAILFDFGKSLQTVLQEQRKHIIIHVTTAVISLRLQSVFSSSESQLTWLIKRDMKALLPLNQSH